MITEAELETVIDAASSIPCGAKLCGGMNEAVWAVRVRTPHECRSNWLLCAPCFAFMWTVIDQPRNWYCRKDRDLRWTAPIRDMIVGVDRL